MEKLTRELDAVLALAGRATGGPWRVSCGETLYSADGQRMGVLDSGFPFAADAANAALIAAAVNLLRSHGAEIREMAKDAERYRFLRDASADEWEVNRWIANDTQELLFGEILDARIDAALRGEGG